MKIAGLEVAEKVVQFCIKRMEAAPFRAADIAKTATAAGAPSAHSYRIAEQLMEQMSQKGQIALKVPFAEWAWVGETA